MPVFRCPALSAPGWRCWLVSGLLLLPLWAVAADQVVSGPALSLQEAVARARTHNPELRAAQYELEAQSGRLKTAGLRPAPELSVEVEDVAGGGTARGINEAQFTLAISQVLELGGRRAARIAVADAGQSQLAYARAARELDVVAEVARRYLHVASDQALLTLARRARALAGETERATERRVAAARAPTAELRRARVARVRAEVDEEHAEHELLSSRQKLAETWGAREADFGVVVADLDRLPVADEFETLAEQLAASPDALRLASDTRLREAERRLVESRARADLSLSAGVRRRQASDDEAFVFGVSLPLFGAARVAGAVDEARAEVARSGAQAEAQALRLRTQLYESVQELRHAVTEAEALRTRVLPEMEAALVETRYAYERGRYGYLEWADAQRELLTLERTRIDAAVNAHRLRIEIERLTGAPLAANS